MKAAVLGSCMSNLTMARLSAHYGIEQTHCIHHNRSDVFIRYHIDGHPMLSLEELEVELKPKASFEKDAISILRNQYAKYMGMFQLEHNREKYGTFFDFIENDSWDLILLDNFMDIAAKLVYDRLDDPETRKPLFINSHFYENEADIAKRYWHTPFLTPQESAENWMQIYRWIRSRQPTAKIVFLSYHSCSSTSSPDRFKRIDEFYPALAALAVNEDLHIIPPLEVVPELTKGQEDWPHFVDTVYTALAGYIYLALVGSLKPPREAI